MKQHSHENPKLLPCLLGAVMVAVAPHAVMADDATSMEVSSNTQALECPPPEEVEGYINGLILKMMAETHYRAAALPRGVLAYDTKRAQRKHYTLLSIVNGIDPESGLRGAVLVDMEGNEINRWPLTALPAKMLPNGNVLGYLTPHDGDPSQENTTLVEMDWGGNIVWQFNGDIDPSEPGSGARLHHDYQREGNPVGYYAPSKKNEDKGDDAGRGTTLILGHNTVDAPAISMYPLEDDVVYEVAENGTVSWLWRASDVIDQWGFTFSARIAIYFNQVSHFFGDPQGNGFFSTDWLHTNSASRVGSNPWYDQGDARFHPDNIVLSSRQSNILAIVRPPDPGDPGDRGEIVWRMGPDYVGPQEPIGQIVGPHHAHMIPRGLPGAGDVLVFDNGGFGGYGEFCGQYSPLVHFRDYSRVVEFDPRTNEVVWLYEHPVADSEGARFFSPLISSAQRLDNGNTLIGEGMTGRVFEVTVEGDIVWEYVSPYTGLGVLAGTAYLPPNSVYRAYRVPRSWVKAGQKKWRKESRR